MNPVLTGEYLRKQDRGLAVPFMIPVTADGKTLLVGCEEVLRHLPGKRLVCRGTVQGQALAIKIFLHSRDGDRHCGREERGCEALAASGLRTPARLLRGRIEGTSIPVLGYEWIAGGKDLAALWELAREDNTRYELVGRAAALIAAHHRKGIRQDDLHFGNFLFAGDRIYTLDGDAVDSRAMGRPLPPRVSIHNIALFLAQLDPRCSGWNEELFRIYERARAWPHTRRAMISLEKAIDRHRRYRKRKFLEKIFRESSDFVRKKTWRYFSVFHREWESDEFRRFIADPSSAFRHGERIKSGHTATLVRTTVDGRPLIVKRYNIKSRRHRLKRLLRPTRAWVSWKNAHLLRFLGIDTPAPVALMEHRFGPMRGTAYFVMEPFDGTNAFDFVHSQRDGHFDFQELAERFNDLFRRLCRQKIAHGDLKATNFVVSDKGIGVVDLDGMKQYRSSLLFQRAFQKDWRRWMKNWEDLPFFANCFSLQKITSEKGSRDAKRERGCPVF